MTQLSSTLWQYYQQTIFLLTQPVSNTSSFSIVTAFNPMGIEQSISQNLINDRRLQKDIDDMWVPYRSIVGASPDLTHMEKSWVLFCDMESGRQLGLNHNQLAIYHVERGRLFLLPCHTELEVVDLGEFSRKIQLVSELPELEY